eukprot:comp21125_c0_seq1/m.28552 comp21125_c0_seq1/g.28552  ORF comp21125_c0_seq1/g.28552 comp21125_c0_seq1/m.28552 type:complete len:501 (-) comp21125_c0_seq1:99-1601(-)
MSMISCLEWVRRGVAAENPLKVELDPEDIAAMLKQKGVADDMEDEMDEITEKFGKQGLGKDKKKKKEKDADDSDTDDSDDDYEDIDIEDPLNMDNYDDDEDGVIGQFAGVEGLVYHASNDQDPYITVKDVDDEDEIEDFTIKPTDNLILVGQSEEEECRVEVYVWEEAEENVYVHHDILVGAVPLCLQWMDFDRGDVATPGNFVAVGSILPVIEIWNLDVVDGMEPACILGQVPEDSTVTGKQKKSKKGKQKTKAKGPDPTKTHTDAVMGLSWNKPNRHILASSSADKTVKLWDLNRAECVCSFTHHKDKVQSVAWSAVEATVLLTGSYDRTVCVFDSRAPASVSTWAMGADTEAVAWNTFHPEQFAVSLDTGMVVGCDARMAGQTLYTIHAHDKAACSLSFSNFIPDCLVTSGADKTVKVWDLQDNKPAIAMATEYKLGPVYAVGFSPDSPLVVAAGGGKGKLKVWDLSANAGVASRFADRIKSLQKQAATAGTAAMED